MARKGRHVLGTLALLAGLAAAGVDAAQFPITPENSTLEIRVPKAGLFSALGHDHDIGVGSFQGVLKTRPDNPSGPELELKIATAAIKVLDPGLSEKDRKKVQEEMEGEQVLNVPAHPGINFRATRITGLDTGDWTITGELTIRGLTREVEFTAEVSGLESGLLEASGTVFLKPGDFGIQPVSALAGTIRTAKTIELRFRILSTARND